MKQNLPAIPQGYGLSHQQSGQRSEGRYSAAARGPITLKINAGNDGSVLLHRAEGAAAHVVVWTTDTTGLAVDQVRGATLKARGDMWELTVPPLPAGASGVPGVQFNRFGGVTASNVGANMTIIGNRVYINGREVNPGPQVSPVHIEAWLPEHGHVYLEGKANQVECSVELMELHVEGTNTSIEATAAIGLLKAELTNGSVSAARVALAEVSAVNGSVHLDDVHRQAKIRTTNGSITVGSTNPEGAPVRARSSNGNITGTGYVRLDGQAANGRVRGPR